jgi:hypothetical protein
MQERKNPIVSLLNTCMSILIFASLIISFGLSLVILLIGVRLIILLPTNGLMGGFLSFMGLMIWMFISLLIQVFICILLSALSFLLWLMIVFSCQRIKWLTKEESSDLKDSVINCISISNDIVLQKDME